MSFMKKRWLGIALFFVSFAICFVIFMHNVSVVNATENLSQDKLQFTLITDANGEKSYKVAIKSTAKPSAETIIIPNTYNDLPVTEIADNGFMSCAKLTRVVLPTTIGKIGNNAFMNCQKLERVGLPAVTSIGNNAFALCPLLDRLFIPTTVTSVGTNILRNNANKVYVQSTIDFVNEKWQSSWNSYFTGDAIYNADPQDALEYRPILDTDAENVIGYELTENQPLFSPEVDVIVYNSIRENDNSQYLPLLNICPEAFTFVSANSIVIKDRHSVDSTAPEYTHSINIRSNAFLSAFVNEVRFETSITFDHPENLQGENISKFDGSVISGDADGYSIKIFEESTIQTITLPSNLTMIPERMFYHCSYLNQIKHSDGAYDGINTLDGITTVGNNAFNSCISLLNISIPSTVTTMGSFVFAEWGDNIEGLFQTINIDYYEGFLPNGWASEWATGIINDGKVNLVYKEPVIVTIDLQDELNSTITIEVIPNINMPSILLPTRNGYVFKGIYSGTKGTGYQYYTDQAQISRLWDEGDSKTLFAYWEPVQYSISYVGTEGAINPNPTSYTINDEIVFVPISRTGYTSQWSISRIEQGSTGNKTIVCSWTPIQYTIHYYVADWKGCTNPNPTTYNITDEINLIKLQADGYDFEWSTSTINIGTTNDLYISGEWIPQKYHINYVIVDDVIHSNPDQYTYNEEMVLLPAMRNGYFVFWDRDSIPAGTMGEVTITASYVEKSLEQCFNNGVYEIWTISQMEQLHEQPNGGYDRTYVIKQNVCYPGDYIEHLWTPIPEFKGILDGNGYHFEGFDIDETDGGNIGFCRINSGTIQNLVIGTRISIGDAYSNVYAGAFAGINKGTISNCKIVAVFNRPFFRCYATGDSFIGCFVGSNEGTITGCEGGDRIQGSCNMGVVAGKNSGIITNCAIGGDLQDIHFEYVDYNACVGGIVGLQTAGKVENCTYVGRVCFTNYSSKTCPVQSENREMQICVGQIIGYKKGGLVSGCSAMLPSGVVTDIVYTSRIFYTVTWTTGSLWNKVTHTNDQALYFRNEICGRVD